MEKLDKNQPIHSPNKEWGGLLEKAQHFYRNKPKALLNFLKISYKKLTIGTVVIILVITGAITIYKTTQPPPVPEPASNPSTTDQPEKGTAPIETQNPVVDDTSQTESPNPRPEQKRRPEALDMSEHQKKMSELEDTLSRLKEELSELEDREETTPATPQESYVYDSYYPIILSLSDNKGGLVKFSSYNKYQGPHNSRTAHITLKVGDTVRWKVKASDPEDRQILYNFNSNSQRFNNQIGLENGRYKYTSNSEINYTISEEDLKTAGETLRIVVQIKSDKEYLRFPSGSGYDDSTFLDYILRP